MKPRWMIVMVLGATLLGAGFWLAWALGWTGATRRTTGTVLSDEEACRQGDMAVCDRLGLCKLKGGCRLAKDGRAAGELFRRACDRGWAAGCYHLGHCYAPYPYCGFVKDIANAAELYKRACEGGYLHGCSYLALTYAAPLGSPDHIDDAIFAAYVERACTGGDQLGCAHLHDQALRLLSAPGHQAAIAIERKACAAGVDHACHLLARCHDTASGDDCGLPKDGARAAAYYEKACRGGDAGSCLRLIRCYDTPDCSLPVPSGQQQRFVGLLRWTCESKGGVLGRDGRCLAAEQVAASCDAGPG